MPAPVISELPDAPLPNNTSVSNRAKASGFVDGLSLFAQQINLYVEWLNTEYYSDEFSVLNVSDPPSPLTPENNFDSEFGVFAESMNNFILQLNYRRELNGFDPMPEMPVIPSPSDAKPDFDSSAFTWIGTLSELPSRINSLSWVITDWTPDVFWYTSFNCAWDAENHKWQYNYEGLSFPNIMNITTLTPYRTWQVGFRPSSVTLVINSGIDSGESDETFDDLSVSVRDFNDNEIGSQTYSFTAFDQSISHTISLTFIDDWDIFAIVFDQTLYLETDGPYIEQVVFNE